MDRLPAIESRLPAWQTSMLANRGADAVPGAQLFPWTEPDSTAAPSSAKGKDPAAEQQRMLTFISHVDAECFISLLQVVDPLPDDYRARAEYKRYYRQLRDSLEVPLSPPDPQPVRTPMDPLV